jgi:hypothetical protein
MHVEFVNHSSVIASHGAVRLMMDFWQEGTVFDNSWSLLCEPTFRYADFAGITHLWFSHEHPDHFSPPNLKAISPELRSRIVVLFQYTQDKRVASFCRKLGFREVVELPPGERFRLADDVEVTCAPFGSRWGEVDSWLLVKTPEHSFLNINDCEIHDASAVEPIRELTGRVDLLATQFSYASKQGDGSGRSWIAKARRYHLDKLALKVAAFAPRFTLPFASFVYWSHREGRYLNEGMVSVHDAAAEIERGGSTPIVMYPGDRWRIGAAWHNAPALDRYRRRYDWCAALPDSAFAVAKPVSCERLIEAANAFIGKMLSFATRRQIAAYLALRHARRAPYEPSLPGRLRHRLRAMVAALRGRYEPGRIYVEDHREAYELSLERGLRPISVPREQCHIAIGSEALLYALSVSWGGETLQINGRFQVFAENGWKKLSELFFLARRLEQGGRLPRSVAAGAVLGRFEARAPRRPPSRARWLGSADQAAPLFEPKQ